MASKVSITAPNTTGETVKVVAQQEGDMVFVWIANGPQVGGFNLHRFGGKLTADSLRTVLFGN